MDHRDLDRGHRFAADREMSMILIRSVLSSGILFLPFATLAAPNTFQDLAFDVVELIDMATMTLIVFGLVAYFWGLSTNILHFGEDEKGEKKKAYFFWGLIILFVMVSIWGIIQLLQNTLFGNQAFSPSTGAQRSVFCDEFGNCGGAE